MASPDNFLGFIFCRQDIPQPFPFHLNLNSGRPGQIGEDALRQLRLLQESLETYTDPRVPGLSRVSPVPGPSAASSISTEVGRFIRPVILGRSTRAQSPVRPPSVTSPADIRPPTVRAGNTDDGGDLGSHRDHGTDIGRPVDDASSRSLLYIVSSGNGRSLNSDDVYPSLSRYSLTNTASTTSLSSGDGVNPSLSRHSLVSLPSLDVIPATPPPHPNNTTSTTSLSSSDGIYPSLSRHSLESLPSLHSILAAVPSGPEVTLSRPDTQEVIQSWLASMEQLTPAWDRDTDDTGDVRRGRKRKASECGGSSTKWCEKPIAVVRPLMAAKKRRL